MSMKLIMYSSTAVIQSNATGRPIGLSGIVSECRQNNPVNDITGALYYRDGRYLQIMEGDAQKVDQLMRNIMNDTRHQHCIVQIDTEIKKRVFPKWQCQLNIVVARDLYLRQFLVNYAYMLRKMNRAQKMAFQHFFKEGKSQAKNDVVSGVSNVFGDEMIRLTPINSSNSDLPPFMSELCQFLAKEAFTVEQLVQNFGEDKRDDVLLSLKSLNNRGLLSFGENPNPGNKVITNTPIVSSVEANISSD